MSSCKEEKIDHAIDVPDEVFHEWLSEFHFFEDLVNMTPREGVWDYQVINSLFTDYALKKRYVYIPLGQKLQWKNQDGFEYPEGTVLIKHFYYDASQLEEAKKLETRLLILKDGIWNVMSYVWNSEGTDARKAALGDIFELTIMHDDTEMEIDYVVPNKNQCKSCHNRDEEIEPLGFKYMNLKLENKMERNHFYQKLKQRNQIEWPDSIFELDQMPSYLDEKVELDQRALAYLEVNCGHCHRPEGPGNTSGLFLQHNETRSNHIGICKSPVAAGKGSGGLDYDIFPGDPEQSILIYRIKSNDPGVMMPEIGRSVIHKEGVELLSKWIASLEGTCN